MFTDSHCHITYEDYNDIDFIIENANKNGINKMINNGVDTKSNKEVIEISKKYKNIYPAIGIHPEYANDYTIEDLKFIENYINSTIAIGEIGLDYHYDGYNKENQKKLFEQQLELATKYSKPVVIHSREATEDTINTLRKYPDVKGVIHCFSGSIETAKIYLKMGYILGIGGVLTFKNSNLYKVIEALPIESFILETDSPYLSPEPNRGKKNEPANIIYIAKRISEIKNISIEELSKITEKNVNKVFDI